MPDEGKTLDTLDVVQGTAEDKVVGVGRGTRQSPKQGQGRGRRMGYTSKCEYFVDAKGRCNLVDWESIAGSPSCKLGVHLVNWESMGKLFKIRIICGISFDNKIDCKQTLAWENYSRFE